MGEQCREKWGPINRSTGEPWYYCELPPGHEGKHDAPSLYRPAKVAPDETDRWWQVFCSVVMHSSGWTIRGDPHITVTKVYTIAGELADVAIAEAKKRGRL